MQINNLLRNKNLWLFVLLAVLFLFVVPSTLIAQKNWYRMGNLTDIALLSLISLGVWITFYMGRINIGQGAFALIGGYVAAYLMQKQGLSFWLSVPLAGLFASFVSVLIGLPILRLRGVYFAMVSLTLTQVATLLALSSPMKPFTGSAGGLTNLPLPGALTIFGLTIIPDFASLPDGKVGFYYLAVILLMVSFLLLHRLVHSRQGILSRSLQQNEELASSIGVDIARLRLISYAICSFVGGVGGAIFISSIQSISSSAFVVKDSVDFMLYCFVGGLSNIFGPIVGATTLYFAWDWLSILGDYQLLVYATLIILLMLFVPNGLLSIRWKNMLDVNNRRQSVATIRKPAATKIKGTVRKGKK